MTLLVLGAGPTGLGAAWRCQELGISDWLLLEASDRPGGLAASFVDRRGFTWDVGGHVQFSHYPYFDQVMDRLLPPEEWLQHRRAAFVWMRERFIPYPLQRNLRHLPFRELRRCLRGLREATGRRREDQGTAPRDLAEWFVRTFGHGLAETFLLPYNFKVWAHPAERLGWTWVGERVTPPDLDRVRQSLRLGGDDTDWGPNSAFRFPRRGGTGAIWRACAAALPPESVRFDERVTGLDLRTRSVRTATGRRFSFDALVSTLPLTELLTLVERNGTRSQPRVGLGHASTHVVGVGLHGNAPPALAGKTWIYFPEPSSPFYRATVFSNYSPENVPDASRYWSIMTETSASRWKPVERSRIVEDTIAALVASRMIERRSQVASIWHHCVEHGYPVPMLGRDETLSEVVPFLERHGLFSRGRFGGWRYEVSNQDHSFMQGVEVVDRLARGEVESVYRLPSAALQEAAGG